MRYLVIDTENTTLQTGSPWNPNNKMVYLGFHYNGIIDSVPVEYPDSKRESVPYIWQGWKNAVRESDQVVFFNAKYDLHWLSQYGWEFKDKEIWDVQLAHFLMTNMTHRLPSLDEVAAYYGLGHKDDKVKELWEQGIDTDQIEESILVEYLEQDVNLTELCYLKQIEWYEKHPDTLRLFKLQMQDMMILWEMEQNGLLLDKEGLLAKGKEIEGEVVELDKKLFEYFGNSNINFGSDNHLSACLYGGILKYKERERYTKTLKSGEVREREHWVVREEVMPRLVEPLPKEKCAKEGYWKTNEGVLLSLKGKKEIKTIIGILLQRSKSMKALDSYYYGFPAMLEEYQITDNILHGQLNQAVAATGRLASSKPNMQNVEERVRQFIITRF